MSLRGDISVSSGSKRSEIDIADVESVHFDLPIYNATIPLQECVLTYCCKRKHPHLSNTVTPTVADKIFKETGSPRVGEHGGDSSSSSGIDSDGEAESKAYRQDQSFGQLIHMKFISCHQGKGHCRET